MPEPTRVAIVTLGCARNEVDSDELAAHLEDGGFRLVDNPDDAAAVLVNSCGFVEAAKQESIDTVLELADGDGGRATGAGSSRPVVMVGCLAERYGSVVADALPEADAVLGFDSYPVIAERLRAVLAGEHLPSHTPQDRRRLLPLAPAERPSAQARPPGHAAPDLPEGLAPASGPRVVRRRLGSGPVAPVKLASGCDRRCSFCAIPAFRGAFTSRPAEEILAELEWLVGEGVREAFLVSENSTSYGKDLGDLRLLEALLPRLGAVDGLARVRVSYLQPAEMRPSLVEAIAATAGVAPYFDLSFQHASEPVLRRMRRFGSRPQFLDLLARVRACEPAAGVRSNVIVGFPGETEADVRELEAFLIDARLDAVGVFGYSSEDGTEAAGFADPVDPDEVAERVERVTALADELVAHRAFERVGESVSVLVLAVLDDEEAARVAGAGATGPHARHGARAVVGIAAHQGPDVDGVTTVLLPPRAPVPGVGDVIQAEVVDAEGVDLVAEVRPRS
jgi:tRNA A37 methylthiotransferase MiaB